MTVLDPTRTLADKQKEACCSEEQLLALLNGDCQPQEVAVIRNHIQSCPNCHSRCMSIAAQQMTAARAGEPTTPSKNIARIGCLVALFLIAGIIIAINTFLLNT